MDWKSEYQRWMNYEGLEPRLRQELEQADDLPDRFYRDLEFGTAGLRGILGAGSNRMNRYTVRRATQALADLIHAKNMPKAVAIAHDSRHGGREFALEASLVLAANGITAWLYPRLEPVPALSWATRFYHCGAGICITASHNPAQYNGYKVYGPDGCQLNPEHAGEIYARCQTLDCFHDVRSMTQEQAEQAGLLSWIPDACLEDYVNAVRAQQVGDGAGLDTLRVVYTPLNGAGLECMQMLFRKLRVSHVTLVPEQTMPDGDFPTCPYPNPEIHQAMERGLALCQTAQPDLLLGTDPDCDRCGIAVPDGHGGYQLLTGNEVGVLLLDYICRRRIERNTMPAHPVAITTIVSTDMATPIAKAYGVELRRVLTGFKYIGEQIDSLGDRFLFGFEESYGYLSGAHVRDKDAVNAALLICEACAWYAGQGMTLLDGLNRLYQTYGHYRNSIQSFSFQGESGMRAMHGLMERLRTAPPRDMAGLSVLECIDYQTTGTGLPPANVLEFRLQSGNKLLVRPSGTEPKIKFYLSCVAGTQTEALAQEAVLAQAVTALVHL